MGPKARIQADKGSVIMLTPIKWTVTFTTTDLELLEGGFDLSEISSIHGSDAAAFAAAVARALAGHRIGAVTSRVTHAPSPEALEKIRTSE